MTTSNGWNGRWTRVLNLDGSVAPKVKFTLERVGADHVDGVEIDLGNETNQRGDAAFVPFDFEPGMTVEVEYELLVGSAQLWAHVTQGADTPILASFACPFFT